MIDLYSSFAHLETFESHGTDFRVRAVERAESPVLVLAPHGGGIEIGTSQLAARIARARYSLFSFEGLKPPWQNRGLHITSHNFDHPLCLAMLARASVVVAIHGCKGESQVFAGGLDEELKMLLAERLREAGFPVATEGHKYLGRNPLNICNRGMRARGAQLEFTRDFREPSYRKVIAPIVRDAITDYVQALRPRDVS
jgi:phage replication-related protein YjqB (UPF0714/DUF867 family)